jgi:amino-acid N-acetyltransferase
VLRAFDIEVTPARPQDEAAIVRLLQDCNLPTADVAEHLPHFFVAWSGRALVGVAGLQPAGEAALLRSLAVVAEFRGHGIARALCARVAEHAAASGLPNLYLLTTTAAPFFAKLGFSKVERRAVPEAVQSTLEFTTLCPDSAGVLAKRLA